MSIIVYWMLHNVKYTFRACPHVHGKVVILGLYAGVILVPFLGYLCPHASWTKDQFCFFGNKYTMTPCSMHTPCKVDLQCKVGIAVISKVLDGDVPMTC